MQEQQILGDEFISINSGIFKELPTYNTISPIDLTFSYSKGMTLYTRALYFSKLSKLNDLALKSTEEIRLHMEGCVRLENDMTNLENKIKKNLKTESGSSVSIFSKNMSFPGKFYIQEQEEKKSSNFITTNNFYFCQYDMVTFDILAPILEYFDEDIFLIKFPTSIGETVVDVLRLYAYICGKLSVLKSKRDSWFKDSFIMLGENIDKNKIIEVKSMLLKPFKNKKIDFKDRYGKKFMIWPYMTVEPNFIQTWNSFINQIYLSAYTLHTLLLLSIDHSSKSIDNPIRLFMKNVIEGKLPIFLQKRSFEKQSKINPDLQTFKPIENGVKIPSELNMFFN